MKLYRFMDSLMKESYALIKKGTENQLVLPIASIRGIFREFQCDLHSARTLSVAKCPP